MQRLLVATRSEGKLREIRRLLGDVRMLELVSLDEVGIEPDPAEDDLEPFDTFEENAISKAQYFHRKSGLHTVADDSGLEVDALGGAPGVRTKRFAPDQGLSGQALDDANNQHLVERLRGVPDGERGCRYVCVAAVVGFGEPQTFRGTAPGVVIEEPRGNDGFGYDPFILNESVGCTYAEMAPDEKDEWSHRGEAFRGVAGFLRPVGPWDPNE